MRILVAVLFATACGSVQAPAPAPVATRFEVEVVGQGQPVILIPGLACSGQVWRDAAALLGEGWELHIVTLPGFAGVPPIDPPFLDTVRSELVRYIETRDLRDPVIIGHSLGAMLAFWVAGSIPDRVGPVVALDGVPYGPALADPGAVPSDMTARATSLRDRVAAVSDADREPQARLWFAPMVTDQADLEWLLEGVLRSDPAAVGQAMYELLTTDVRTHARRLTRPTLLIVAGEHFAGEPAPDLSGYVAQLSSHPDNRVVLVPGTRHFVMLDAPERVYGEIARFLARAAGR